MRLMTFEQAGKTSYGVATDKGVIDLGGRIGDEYPTLLSLIEGQGQAAAEKAASGQGDDYTQADVTFLPVIPRPNKIICVGLN